ncbi:glycosyltransferase family 39 protein [Diaminobutyricibacter sp. McL0618]|uniref:glycosyltransferase family 39 protein n=1 Tax=Leifsonia sp. McL0618 TaxID=3415677 RepID=UPI003CEA338B
MSKTIDRTTKPAPVTAVRASVPLRYRAALFGVAGVVVAAWGSWVPSLWGDEVTSLMSAERPLPSLFAMLRHVDAVHGTYYFGLHWWVAVFGPSPFSIRFPSAIAVGLMVAAVVVVATRVGSARLGVIAGVVCLLLPRVTYMGEEARSFAFSAAIVAWLTVILLELLRRESAPVWLWIAYGALLAVGIYVFLYVALFVLVHAVTLVAVRAPRHLLVRWATTAGIAAAITLPLVVFAVLERKQISYLASHDQLSPDTVFSSLWFGAPWFAAAAWALIVVAMVDVVRMRVRRAEAGVRPPFFETTRTPSLVLVASVWLFLPTLVLVLGSAAIPAFTARYVSFCAPAAALLIACGIEVLARGRRWVDAVALVALAALAAPIYFEQRTPYAKNDSDWAVISSVIGSHAVAGDAVVFDEGAHPSKKPRMAMHAYPAGFVNTRDVTLDVPYTANNGWADRAYSVAHAASLGRFDGIRRVWLLEYVNGGKADTYGTGDLERLGFEERGAVIHTHRGLIVEFTR